MAELKKEFFLGQSSVNLEGERAVLKVYFQKPDVFVFEDVENFVPKSSVCFQVSVLVETEKGSSILPGYVMLDFAESSSFSDTVDYLDVVRFGVYDYDVGLKKSGIFLESKGFISLPDDFVRKIFAGQVYFTEKYVSSIYEAIKTEMKNVEAFLVVCSDLRQLKDLETTQEQLVCIPFLSSEFINFFDRVILKYSGKDRFLWKLGDVFYVYQSCFGKYFSEAIKYTYRYFPELFFLFSKKSKDNVFMVTKEEMRKILDVFLQKCNDFLSGYKSEKKSEESAKLFCDEFLEDKKSLEDVERESEIKKPKKIVKIRVTRV